MATDVIANTSSALDVDRETAMAIVSRCSTTPFLVKLWAMLDDPENTSAIEWDATGDNFEVKDPSRMSRDVLPKHFRHNNFSSFQRQLNYFGFRKTGKTKDRGCVYTHDDFCLRRPHDVLRIRRKTNTGGAKGHHTNKCGQLLNLEISPLNTSCPAGTKINGRRPTMKHLKVDVPSCHAHGTRCAVRIKRAEERGLHTTKSAVLGKRRETNYPDFSAHASPLSGFSGPVTPVSAHELPLHGSKRPRLAITVAANAAGVQDIFFDMDPCLSPLSPLRLTEPALPTQTSQQQSEMQAIFDGLGPEPFSASQPFSPIMVLKTPKTPLEALGFSNAVSPQPNPKSEQHAPVSSA